MKMAVMCFTPRFKIVSLIKNNTISLAIHQLISTCGERVNTTQPVYLIRSLSTFDMELTEAIRLIEKGVDKNTTKQVWADLGAGHGIFTKALASMLTTGSRLYAMDTNAKALNTIHLDASIALEKLQQDFIEEEIKLELLDGIMMGNSLHYVKEKSTFLKRIKNNLRPGGRIIIVEYDLEKSNPWVPYPVGFNALKFLSEETGFSQVVKLAEHPSVLNTSQMYSALLS